MIMPQPQAGAARPCVRPVRYCSVCALPGISQYSSSEHGRTSAGVPLSNGAHKQPLASGPPAGLEYIYIYYCYIYVYIKKIYIYVYIILLLYIYIYIYIFFFIIIIIIYHYYVSLICKVS